MKVNFLAFLLVATSRPSAFSQTSSPSDVHVKLSLAEVDAVLLDQIRNFATTPNNRGSVSLKQKTSLLVRFATDGIYQELMELYRAVGGKLYR